MMKKMPEKKNELREAFKSFDADGDGSTTVSYTHLTLPTILLV